MQIVSETLFSVSGFVNIAARNNNVVRYGITVEFRVIMNDRGLAVSDVGKGIIGNAVGIVVWRVSVRRKKANADNLVIVIVNKLVIYAGRRVSPSSYAVRRVSPSSLNEDAVGSEDRFILRSRKAVVINDFSGNIASAVVDGNIPLNIFVERNTVFFVVSLLSVEVASSVLYAETAAF